MNKQTIMKQKRISLEILRIIALCMVIFNHTGENGFEMFRTTYGTFLWYFVVLLDIVSKAGVPLFFMISGVLLLGKDESIKDLFLKRILRYTVIIVLFSFIYYIHLYIQHPEYGFSIKFFITYIYSTPFITPFWFLYSYLSFLLVLPVLRAVVRTLKEKEYFLLLGVSAILWLAPVWENILKLDSIAINNGLGATFIFYPIIGYGIYYVLSDRYFDVKSRTIVVITFTINWLCAFFMNIREYNEAAELSGANIDRFSWIPAIAIFYFIIYIIEKKQVNISEKGVSIWGFIGSTIFATYLFEDMLRSDIFLRMFDCVSGNGARLLMCIPYTLCIIGCGVLISVVLKRIPGIKLLKI